MGLAYSRGGMGGGIGGLSHPACIPTVDAHTGVSWISSPLAAFKNQRR
jgi:hypothetical protein